MKENIDGIVRQVLANGVALVENVMPKERCAYFIEALEGILSARGGQGQNIGNGTSQVLRNYFVECGEAIEIFDNDLVDGVMRQLIDDDYIMTSTVARNLQIRPSMNTGAKTGGVGWHTDTRYVRGRRFEPSLQYYSVYLLNDFTADNGATEYVPGSAQWLERPQREASYEYEKLIAPAGSVVFFDSALVHRAGEPAEAPRWGIFSHFNPWFVKPYYRYDSLFSEEQVAQLSPRARQLFHFDSIPPGGGDDYELATLRRVNERLASLS